MRNKNLQQVLAVRLTMTPKPTIPSIVPLSAPEVFVGSVGCDDIVETYEDEVRRDLGALSPRAMSAVAAGLAAALGLG